MSDYELDDRYQVTRRDGRDKAGEKHEGCRYFVLDLTHDPKAARLVEEYFAERGEAGDYTPTPEAVEAASAVMWARRIESPWSSASEHARASLRRDMTAALAAAGPLIAAQERERVLDALRPEYSDLIPTIRARTARGEGS